MIIWRGFFQRHEFFPGACADPEETASVREKRCRDAFLLVDPTFFCAKRHIFVRLIRIGHIMQRGVHKEKSFEELFRKNYSRAFYYALDWVGDEETAKDVVSDCFGEMWRQYERLSPMDLEPYLFRMVKNRCLNILKHRAVEENYRGEAQLRVALVEEETDWHEELLEKVEEAVEALNPQTRRVLDLCYFQGKKYAEAAEVLGISANTVHKHISKAMAFLREALFNKKH